jgi:hypothetical protein
MIFLDQITHGHFEPLTGQVFQSGELALTLDAVELLGNKRADAARDPFSLLFRGPQGLRVAQGIYRLKNESLGEMEIFITQVADGPKGSQFEAVFT